MRRGLLKTVQLPDERTNRFQANVRDALEVLSADDDTLQAPITSMAVAGQIAAGKSVVWYTGAPGATLTLPPANALGANVAALLAIVNASSGAITIRPSGADTVNGGASLSLAAGGVLLLVSDGQGATSG